MYSDSIRNMNILWLKDGKLGHEKQVKALLKEISKTEDIKIKECVINISKLRRILETIFYFINSNQTIPYSRDKSSLIEYEDIDIIIGAGSNVYISILKFKKDLKKIYKKDVMAISVLLPSYFRNRFDIICAPIHDSNKLMKKSNIIFFEGSLASTSDDEPEDNVGLIGIGGKNKHYIFDEKKIIQQIEYLISIYPNKKWHIFSSRRTSKKMVQELRLLSRSFTNIHLVEKGFDEIVKKASIKIITPDSMNMVYESISTKGSTLLFNMRYLRENKITKQINRLIQNKQVGYLEYSEMVDGLSKITMQKQNAYHEIFSEVERLAFKLIKKLKNN